jgi:fatty acid desaturase
MLTFFTEQGKVNRSSTFSESSYPRGYRAPRALEEKIKKAHATRTVFTLVAILSDYCYSFGAIWLAYAAWRSAGALIGIAVSGLACIVVARGQRALEALLHEGAHKNWSRRARLNSTLCTILAATPVIADVREYWNTHRLHHSHYGTGRDTDRVRYVELLLDDLDRSSLRRFAAGIIMRLPRYVAGWYRAVGSNKSTVARFAIWLGFVCAASWMVSGEWAAGVFVPSCWLVGLALVLPVIRIIGEAAEHTYLDGDTVFDTTVTNCGLIHRLIFHPHGDGYHLVHHMWPGVPHHAIRKLHHTMMAHDLENYAKRAKVRTHVLQEPI